VPTENDQIKAKGGIVVGPSEALPAELEGGKLKASQVPISAASGSVVYKALAGEPALLISGAITRSSTGAALKAPVVWPDGATGEYVGVESETVSGAIDSYTITHVEGETTHTYTQAKVTRNSEGVVTNRPAITYA
jgi:hypothetical protein